MLEKRLFNIGLNLDDEDRFIPQGEYTYALNIRAGVSDSNNHGAIENSKGNTLINFTLPSGENKVIGSFNDKKLKTVIYFVYNSNNLHQILSYSATANEVTSIFKSEILNFCIDQLITGVNIVDDKLLYWTDDKNEIGHIDIDLAVDNYYGDATSTDITAIVKPHIKEPTVAYFNDTTRKFNNLKGNVYQFRTQYLYTNSRISSWSPISKLAIPEAEVFTFSPDNQYANNGLRITYDTGNKFVDKINIAVRVGNFGAFQLIDTIKRKDVSSEGTITSEQVTYDYFNDKVPIGLDQSEVNQLFSWIPKAAKSQELIDGNRLAWGNILEGQDPIEIDATATPVYKELNSTDTVPNYIVEKNQVPSFVVLEKFISEIVSSDNGSPILYGKSAFEDSNTLRPAFDSPGVQSSGANFFTSNYGADKRNSINFNLDDDSVSAKIFLDISYEHIIEQTVLNQTFTSRSDVLINISEDFTQLNSNTIVNDDGVTVIGVNESMAQAVNQKGIVNQYDLTADNTNTFFATGGSGGDVEDFGIGVTGSNYATSVNNGVYISRSITAIRGISGDAQLSNSFELYEVNFDWLYYTGNNVTYNIIVPHNTLSADALSSGAFAPNSIKLDPKLAHQYKINQNDTNIDLIPTDVGTPTKTFKRAATHDFAISYHDDYNRSTTALIDEDLSAYVEDIVSSVPQGTGRTENPNADTNRGSVEMSLQINSFPPPWATSYQILYAGNRNISNTVQIVINEVETLLDKMTFRFLAITDYNNENPNSLLTYSFAKGDRIRVLQYVNPFGKQFIDELHFADEVLDFEIIDYDVNTLEATIYLPTGLSTATLLEIQDGITAEIYSPKLNTDEEDRFYYEIGRSFPINTINGLKVHGGHTSQTDSNPAIVNLTDDGDCYLRFRGFPVSTGALDGIFITRAVEDFSVSDFYESRAYDRGRPNKVDEEAKEVRRPTTLRYTSPYVPETNINGLSEVFDISFEEYDKRYGSIQKLYSEDKRLIIFQELKVGAALVNELIYRDLAGNEAVGASSTILSTIIYYAGEYGIGLHPESFAVYGNSKYFADTFRGCVVRLSSNGLFPISEYKVHNYFTDTFKEIYDNPDKTNIYGTYDKRFEEYVLSYDYKLKCDLSILFVETPIRISKGRVATSKRIDRLSANKDITKYLSEGDLFRLHYTDSDQEQAYVDLPVESISVVDGRTTLTTSDTLFNTDDLNNAFIVIEKQETIAFCEKTNRWSTFYSYQPDWIEENGSDMVSFKDGKIYTHNTNANRNQFYGEDSVSEIEFISNEAPSKTKFYKGTQVESNNVWSMPTATNQQGQKTSLIVEDFEHIEDHFYAAFLKDENTPNVDNPIIEGEDMRSYTLRMRLRNSDQGEAILFGVGIKFEASELSNQ